MRETHSRRSRFDLIVNLARADLRSRFQATSLGVLWSALNPALTAVVVFVVFGRVVRLGVENYGLFVLAAVVPWGFLAGCVTQAASSLLRHRALVGQVRMPRAPIVVAVALGNLPALLIGLVLVAVVGFFHDGSIQRWLVWLPLAVVTQLTFVVGVGLLAAVATAFFRDVEYLLAAAIRAAFFLSPNLYPIQRVPEQWRALYLMNPMTGILEMYRAPLLSGEGPAASVVAAALLISVAALAAGVVVFRIFEADLDDYV